MRTRLVFVLLWLPLGALAQQPLSAIDWMNTTAAAPVAQSAPGAALNEPAVSKTAVVPDVSVTPLDQPRVDAVGLLPGNVTGLPATLWRATPTASLVTLLKGQDVVDSPAMQTLFYTLLLAEAEAPHDAGRNAPFLLARIDALINLGAVEQAQALVERAGTTRPALFSRWFDLTLLSGDEDAACAALQRWPGLAPGYGARIFCLVRLGDWPTAALTLDTARALGFVSKAEDALLTRFLDPELFEGEDPLPLPKNPSPLTVRMHEAIGESLSTATMPRAFAMSDLRNTVGWKAELEAAERLARTGALSENRLLGIYTQRLRAASGGIWDRVEALQRFDTAITAGDPGAIATTLPVVWAAMGTARIEVPFARLYGNQLAKVPLSGSAGALAFRVGLLSNEYETIANGFTPVTLQDRFLKSIALGAPDAASATTPLARAIAEGFTTATPPAELQTMLAEGRLGEMILNAMSLYSGAMAGDVLAVSSALASLRAVGLEDTARQAALQLLLLDRGV